MALPVLFIKPILPSSSTLASPFSKYPILSYLQGITSLPVLSIKPILPFNFTLVNPSSEKTPILSYLI